MQGNHAEIVKEIKLEIVNEKQKKLIYGTQQLKHLWAQAIQNIQLLSTNFKLYD